MLDVDEFFTLSLNQQKRCTGCKEIKNHDDFYRQKSGTLYALCISCRNIYSRDKHLKYKYGITVQQYEDMLKKQNYVCAVCEKPETALGNKGVNKSLSVHHNHTTGKVIALCCGKCNRAMGIFNDDPALLRKAADLNDNF